MLDIDLQIYMGCKFYDYKRYYVMNDTMVFQVPCLWPSMS